MKIRFTDTLHQDEPTLFSVERRDTMRDTRRNVISLTDINVHGVARIVSFDDGRAFKDKENIAYMSMPVPSDTFVTNEANSRNPHVRTNCYMLQAISALARRPKIIRGVHRRSPCGCD
jgi:hypothetical protein